MSSELSPAFKNGVAVFFACDDAYAPYAGVTIASLLENSSPGNAYDLWVLDGGVSEENKAKLLSLVRERPNVSLRFTLAREHIDDGFLKRLHLDDNISYISVATYYRLFVASIFKNYDKMLYLDCDLLLAADVGELCRFEMGPHPVAACPDPATTVSARTNADFRRYLYDVLKLDERSYFNAGVLLFNLAAVRDSGLENDFMRLLREIKRPKFNDQDILNAACQGRVAWLPTAWNHLALPLMERASILKEAWPAERYDEFLRAEDAPKIIHYVSALKPWKSLAVKHSRPFWACAQRSPWAQTISAELLLSAHEALGDLRRLIKVASPYRKLRRKRFRYALMARLFSGTRRERYLQKIENVDRTLRLIETL